MTTLLLILGFAIELADGVPEPDGERARRIANAVAVLDDPKSREDDEKFVAAIDEIASQRGWEASRTLAEGASFRSYAYQNDPRVPSRIRPTFALKYPATAALTGLGSAGLPGIIDAIASSDTDDEKLHENLRTTIIQIVGAEPPAYELLLKIAPADLSPTKQARVRSFAKFLSPNNVQDIKTHRLSSEAIQKNLSLTGRQELDKERILTAIKRAREGVVWAVLPELVEKLEFEQSEQSNPGDQVAAEVRYPAIGAIVAIGPGALPAIVDGIAKKDRSPIFRKNAASCIATIVGSDGIARGKSACELLLSRMASHYPKDEAARINAFAEGLPEISYVPPLNQEPTPAEPKKP